MSSEGGGQRVGFDLWRFADHEGHEQNWAFSKGGTGWIYFILFYFRGHVNCQFTSSAEGWEGAGECGYYLSNRKRFPCLHSLI